MSTIIELQPAFLLHSRPFRDSSLLLDFLTPDYGRVSAIARGGRSAKSKNKSLLQPFTPIQVSMSGKSDLKTLRTVELRSGSIALTGERLFSALYMNEIIVRLFQGHESNPNFFNTYEQCLLHLTCDESPEPVLRQFEMALLDSLGYGIDFSTEANSQTPIEEKCWYYFQEGSGFVKAQIQEPDKPKEEGSNSVYRGEALLNIHARNFNHANTCQTAKNVIRGILNNQLGPNPLCSRALFKSLSSRQ
ncbi:MAG: DNA repair protein RecO [Gammaproteobacteria bacterium]|nr:DNA repair protein RecO [Gammaproteobacteria bacterium]